MKHPITTQETATANIAPPQQVSNAAPAPSWAFGGAGDSGARDEKPTLGEKTARWMTEGGLNWFANSVISLISTQLYNQFLVPTKTMQNFFNNWVERTAAPDATELDKFKSRRSKMDIFETAFMCLWGTMLMIPYKVMRDNTQKRGYQYDEMFERWGLQKKGTADAKAQARGEDKENPVEEKVSWGDLLISRVTGIAVAIYAGVTLENHASGKWFKNAHPEGADIGEQKTLTNADGSIAVQDIIEKRGVNFKHGMYKMGNSVARSLENTALGQRFNIKASTDQYITKPTPAEGFVFLVGKEMTLTGILAMTMPTVLDIINKIRGKDKAKPAKANHKETAEPASAPVVTSEKRDKEVSKSSAAAKKEHASEESHRRQDDDVGVKPGVGSAQSTRQSEGYAEQENKTEGYKTAVRTGHLARSEERFDGASV